MKKENEREESYETVSKATQATSQPAPFAKFHLSFLHLLVHLFAALLYRQRIRKRDFAPVPLLIEIRIVVEKSKSDNFFMTDIILKCKAYERERKGLDRRLTDLNASTSFGLCSTTFTASSRSFSGSRICFSPLRE